MDFSREQIFVARWRRILIPWGAKTEAEAVRDMERSCMAVILGMFLFLGFNEGESAWSFGLDVLVVAAGLTAMWAGLRLRGIARLFDLAGPQSFPDLQQQLLQQHRNAIRTRETEC